MSVIERTWTIEVCVGCAKRLTPKRHPCPECGETQRHSVEVVPAAQLRGAVEARGPLRALIQSMRDTSDDEMRVTWGNEALTILDRLGGQ